MCGILGLYINPEIRFENALVSSSTTKKTFDEAVATLSHRGPDASGSKIYDENGVFLGHTRLSIQDLSSAGAQPMTSPNKKYTITFNGEIYNFPTLKKDLINRGYVFSSNTDTEVILYLYAEYGVSSFSMLDGIFALAIFDKGKDQLIVARDGLGIKPLYYYIDANGYAFSSELKALECLLADKKLTLDVKNISRYLTFQWCPGDGTPFAEIKKHNPGEAFVIKSGSIIDTIKFYQLPIMGPIIKSSGQTTKKIVSDLDASLRKAVHDQMLSDAPVGAFLSGGLDSTSVVAFAKEVDPSIDCFTIDTQTSLNDGMKNDLPYAIAAAKHLDVPLHVVRIDSASLVKNLEKMVWMLDEPLGDPAPLNVLYISELARSNGIKVLLSGTGGDDIFTGYRRHQAVSYDNKLQLLPNCLLTKLEKVTGKLDKRVTFFRRLAKLFNGSSLTGDQRCINYFKWIDNSCLIPLFSDEFSFEVNATLVEQPMTNFLEFADPESSALDRMLALEQRFFTTDHNLLYTDKMSMAVGVEVRVPLLAQHLVEFAATIPDKLKQNGKAGKWIFKKTMEPYLPKSIIYRSKTGFGAPLREWLKNELREYMEDLLSYASLSSRGIFNAGQVRLLIQNNDNGKVDNTYTIFSLMCIEIWCRQHIDTRFIVNS